jgi:hypothetical protein
MSFSMSWQNSEVCQSDAAADLALEKASLCSPLLTSMEPEVKAAAEKGVATAVEIIGGMESQSGLYNVTISGHVGKGGNALNVSVSERYVAPVVAATEDASAS